MANISHWHNRSHPKEDVFLELMAQQDWGKAQFEAKSDPLVAYNPTVVRNFLGSSRASKITPMHQACAYGAPLELIEFLHQVNPAFLVTRDSHYKRLPLHVAFIGEKYSKTPEIILKLIELDSRSAMGKDALGRYPLHYACHHRAPPQIIEELIRLYPQAVDHADDHGWLPIHVACRSSVSMSVIKKLLELNPESVHKETDKGSTPVDCAQKAQNHSQITEVFENKATGFTETEETNTASTSASCEDDSKFIDLHDSMSGLLGSPREFLSLPPRDE